MRAEELSQTAFDSLPDHVCVLDRSGTIILTNRAWDRFAQLNGGDPRRCGHGVNYLDVSRAAQGEFSEGAARAAEGIEEVLRGAAFSFTLDYACPSTLVAAWFRLTATPLHPSRDGAVIAHTNITDQTRLGERLHRIEERYEAVMENPGNAATVLEMNGIIHYQSPATESAFGYRSEELIHRNFLDFVHPDDASAVRKLLDDCRRQPNVSPICTYRFKDKNGAWRTMECVARKLLTGPPERTVINSRDVTAAKRVELTLLSKQESLIRRRDELDLLVARLLHEQEEERRRTAAELQKDVGQRLERLSLLAAQLANSPSADARQLSSLREGIGRLSGTLQALAHQLHPPMLDQLGLAVALREYCDEFTRREGVQVTYTHREIPGRLSSAVVAALYRVAEEALTNVARHANTNRAWVTLSQTARGIRMVVRDAGAGFDPAGLAPGAGLGILRMRERLRAIDGTLTIHAAPGKGVQIVALVPLNVSR
ncbi:MAG TPA: PAS domain S-box protein [Bryobacteraceae bacterium]|nr:PAS domain S-box protein [Bryobacteraceae bacterium]